LENVSVTKATKDNHEELLSICFSPPFTTKHHLKIHHRLKKKRCRFHEKTIKIYFFRARWRFIEEVIQVFLLP
jgi:hypothetical protein